MACGALAGGALGGSGNLAGAYSPTVPAIPFRFNVIMFLACMSKPLYASGMAGLKRKAEKDGPGPDGTRRITNNRERMTWGDIHVIAVSEPWLGCLLGSNDPCC